MSISHDDVERITRLLEASQFDALHLEMDGLKLSLRRAGARAPAALPAATAAAAVPAATGPAPAHQAPAEAARRDAGLVEVKAPMLGTFFCAPKPGADAFVAVGSRVEPDTVVGIVEVMKLMNAVSAGVRGEVVEIVAPDAQLVEYEQVLVRVRPL
jgi:acetyl-CoA carboxylase biotin carboxyl carrier protein